MDRDQFVQDFVKRGRESGATKEQVTEKLTTALKEFDSKFGKEKEDTRSPLQKVTDFMGLGNVSKTATMALQSPLVSAGIEKQGKVSQDLFKQSQELIKQAKMESDPTKKAQLLDQSRQIDAQIGGAGERSTRLTDILKAGGQITDREMEMDKNEFALRRGGATALEVGSYLAPGVVGPATTLAGRIGVGAGRGALTGALQGGARATTEAESLGEAGVTVGTGAVVGGLTGAAMQGLVEGAKGAWNQVAKITGNQRQKFVDLYKSTLKSNIKDQKFYSQYGGEDTVARDAIKYKIAPTKEGVVKQLDQYKPDFNRKVEEEIAKNQSKTIDISKAFENAKKRVRDQFGHDETLLKSGMKWFEDNSEKYTNQKTALLKSSNNLRKKLDTKVGDILTAEAAPADAARKAFATELRQAFRDQLPQLRDTFKKYQLLSGLSEAMQKEPRTGIVELAGAGILPGTGGMNIIEFLASKAVRSPGLRRAVAERGVRAGTMATSPATQLTKYLTTPATSAASSQIPPELKRILGI